LHEEIRGLQKERATLKTALKQAACKAKVLAKRCKKLMKAGLQFI
jgi:hypothetical protein